MFQDLTKYFAFLSSDEKGKRIKNRIFFFLIISLALFLINKIIFYKFVDAENFQIYSALSNLLFFKGISPYSKEISSILVNYFSARDITLSSYDFIFQLPIYQLVIYLPFSLITDPSWSLSIWLTINQCLFLLCGVSCIQMFKWKPRNWFLFSFLGIILISFFGISNYIDTNSSFFQLFFFIAGLKLFSSEKYILAGLFLGLATIDPFNFFIPILFVLAFLVNRKQTEPIFWFIISITLLTISGLIFDSSWILKFLRNIFLEGSFYPFIDYNHALLNWISKLLSGDLVKMIPILLGIWIILEYSRLPKQSSNHLVWILCLIICINPFIIMRETNYASVLYLLPIIFIAYLWENHSSGLINKVIFGILSLSVVVLPFLTMLFPVSFNFLANFHSINLINSFLIIIILYWIRWWVIKPYDYLMP